MTVQQIKDFLKDIALIILLFLGILALAVFMDAHGEEFSEAEAMFVKIDTNKDTFIDVTEFNAWHLAMYDDLDTDRDGLLSSKECKESCFSDDTKGKVPRYPFETIDSDYNKLITVSEYVAYIKQQFRVSDRNEDRVLDKKEFIALHAGLDERSFIAEDTQFKGEE